MPNPVRGLDDLIQRMGDVSAGSPGVRAAANAVYEAQRPGWRHAEDLLYRYPQSLDHIDQFVGDNKMTLGRHLGAGSQSIVWEAHPASGEAPQVLKVRVGDAEPSDFDFPDNVPGVASYWARAQTGQNVAAALQPRASVVYRPESGLEKPFSNAAERLKSSLLSRGLHWSDGHKWNLGVMPDGTWNVIDGWLDAAHPSWSRPNISEEESIRMLRLTPEERAAIYGAP